MDIEVLYDDVKSVSSSKTFKKNSSLQDLLIYRKAKLNRISFWEEQANELNWFKKWKTPLIWNKPYAKWFVEGQLNASYNCIDIHLKNGYGKKTAIIWESEKGETFTISYDMLYKNVSQLAYQLKNELGVKKEDRVTIYMPMIPEAVYSILACSRIGAIHNVVFAGFSAQSLKERIADSDSKYVITANGGYRRGKVVPLKDVVNQALCNWDHSVKHVLVKQYIRDYSTESSTLDVDYDRLLEKTTQFLDAEPMNSEDILFILYTSGTTGKPKGIVHTTGGYLTHAKYSTKVVFDLNKDDIYWCGADIGWITGHTYFIYGPLANGATCLMYEGGPDYPHKGRYWELIDKHKVSILYTAPTAVRSFMKWGTGCLDDYSLQSLRLLGTVGEPINPEAWMWYYTHIGKKKCPIVDTWWQTETGGIMISNLPALNDMKPGSAGLPLPGINAAILASENGYPIEEGGGLLSLTEPWPSMLRGIWGDAKRYQDTYWSKFDTYFAGDGASIDKDGYIKVVGRVDDVLNVSGHRIGTMEVESALVDNKIVAEAAVIGVPDEIKGEAIMAFVILKGDVKPSDAYENELIQHVSTVIGAIAKPKKIIFTPELPKTRSGKIIRRSLRNLAQGKSVGDLTTLANPAIIDLIRQLIT